ncbi:MerR family transcriptional regulator [Jatrophihabitans sp. DSM 45814]
MSASETDDSADAGRHAGQEVRDEFEQEVEQEVEQDPERDAARGTPIGEVSAQLGVPIPTLRSWELRYGIPESTRTGRKHRRYSTTELQTLALMRDEIARGKRASLAAESVRAMLGLSGPATVFVTDVLDAAKHSDPIAIRDALSDARLELGLGSCLDDVLLPAMQQVGFWWQTGRCDVAQEHLATEAARGWLEGLNAFAPAPRHGHRIVLACGPTDLHTIGLEALGVLLRYRYWPCRLLGARTSEVALRTATLASDAGGVVVVSHMNSSRRRAVQSLQSVDELGASLFYAGNAFNSPRSRRNIPGRYLGSRLQGACDLIEFALTKSE